MYLSFSSKANCLRYLNICISVSHFKGVLPSSAKLIQKTFKFIGEAIPL